MNAERSIFEYLDTVVEAAGDAAAVALADADIAAGRVVDHAKVAAWLAKWGTPDQTPMPAEWLA